MKRLSELHAGDALSELLRALHVRSTVWCLSELAAPWAFGVARRDVSCFHVVLAGGGWLDVDGAEGRRRLAAGDLIVLGRGHGHALRDQPGTPVTMLDDLLAAAPPADGRLRYGGDGAVTEILCGGFVLEGRGANPLLALLPSVLHVPGSKPWLSATLELLRRELPASAPGADAVVTRLTDLLVTQALRDLLAGRTGIRTLADPWIAGVLRMVHDHPERAWTIAELSAAAALSRSAFAERFRELTGEAPIRYVARVRLSRAAELLRDTELAQSEIARRCGYESAASLNRAFKRAFGTSPGRYRRDAPEARELVATRASAR